MDPRPGTLYLGRWQIWAVGSGQGAALQLMMPDMHSKLSVMNQSGTVTSPVRLCTHAVQVSILYI